MTPEGYARLEEELRHLKSVERPAVIRAIAEAREHGDLSENAEYHAARERQSFIEGRLAELEDKISRAEVIDVSKLSGRQVKFVLRLQRQIERRAQDLDHVPAGLRPPVLQEAQMARRHARSLRRRGRAGCSGGQAASA